MINTAYIRQNARESAAWDRPILAKKLEQCADEIERLRAALKGLHDWYVEYAKINNLFNADGTPATFHELLVARRELKE